MYRQKIINKLVWLNLYLYKQIVVFCWNLRNIPASKFYGRIGLPHIFFNK